MHYYYLQLYNLFGLLLENIFLMFLLPQKILQNQNVQGIDMLQTRIFGNKIYVDVEILLDATLPLGKAHAIAEDVHDDIERNFPKVKHIMIHVNPYEM